MAIACLLLAVSDLEDAGQVCRTLPWLLAATTVQDMAATVTLATGDVGCWPNS
uniref:Uncharacterized protein n=1 Tax=Arundo donax TaxID=35708 RepID=A0A0A9GGX5_ARUDO